MDISFSRTWYFSVCSSMEFLGHAACHPDAEMVRETPEDMLDLGGRQKILPSQSSGVDNHCFNRLIVEGEQQLSLLYY